MAQNLYDVSINDTTTQESSTNIEYLANKLKKKYNNLNFVIITDENNKSQTIYGYTEQGESSVKISILQK